MLSNTQLLEQLSLQHKMNATVNPDWVRADYNWTRAIMVEAVEALDHLGWKWWKALPTADQSQFRMELVDVWHFVLSNELAYTEGDPHEAAANLRAAERTPNYVITAGHKAADLRELAARDLLHVLIGAAAFGDVHLTAFGLLLERAGMSWDTLHKSYIAKNVLNLFRQAHGYKDGSYLKEWDGREDNEVLSEMVALDPQLTPDELMARLRAVYVQLQPAIQEASA